MRFRGGAWFAFLLPLGLTVVACAGNARASEADASPLYRTRAWIANLDEQASALRAMPELRLSGMDGERLRALSALLSPPPCPGDFEGGEGECDATEDVPGAAPGDAESMAETFIGSSMLKPRLFRLMRHDAAVDRMESAIYGLDSLARAVARGDEAGDVTGEARAAVGEYLRCVCLLARFELAETENAGGVPGENGNSAKTPANAAANVAGGDTAESNLRALRQDALLVALDAALAHDLPPESARPLRVIKAGLLLEQARPQAALQALDGVDAGSVSTPREKRLRARGLYLRALALMRRGNFGLAGKDLDRALALMPDGVELRLARGTLLRMRGETTAMCGDFYAACAGGLCEGLKVAREQGYCGAASAAPASEDPPSPVAPLELER